MTLSSPKPVFNARTSAAPRVKARVGRHDPLHMQEGLTCCWCMCGLCWVWQEINGKLFGRCVCNRCPCRNEQTYDTSRSVVS